MHVSLQILNHVHSLSVTMCGSPERLRCSSRQQKLLKFEQSYVQILSTLIVKREPLFEPILSDSLPIILPILADSEPILADLSRL